ncbi:MAG: Ig domain-containing protein [Desulfobacteraceae bacterium]
MTIFFKPIGLDPPGSNKSLAYGTDGVHQTGMERLPDGTQRAGLWYGSADSWVRLHPSGAISSAALAVMGDTQVGNATFSINGSSVAHTALWHNTVESFIDMHPENATNSSIGKTTGNYHSGYTTVNGNYHASIWLGDSADDWFDLHTILDSKFENGGSSANNIYQSGEEIWVVGNAADYDADHQLVNSQAVVWHYDPDNNAPIFTSIEPKIANEGELVEFTVVATDPDNDNVTLSAQNIPLGASFDAISGIFSWIPDYLQKGFYEITFTATDNGDPVESSEMDVSITVNNICNSTQLTDDLIDEIEASSLPNNVINSYLANLKKVNTFIEKDKIKPAVNQLFAFMCKVEKDLSQGKIHQDVADLFLFMSTEIIQDLNVDPTSRTCS